MANKRITESASAFERSGIRFTRARAIEVLLYYGDHTIQSNIDISKLWGLFLQVRIIQSANNLHFG